MKRVAIALSLLVAYAKAADNCWSLPDFPCCSEGNTEVMFSDDNGDWGVENDEWCGIIYEDSPEPEPEPEPYYNPYNMPPDLTNVPPELEVIPIDLPDDYCWSSVLNKYPCCRNKRTPMSSFEMDGRIGIENDVECGIKGYHAIWNDREKYVATKSQWEEFKVKWDNEYRDNFERLSVYVGEDESQLNFGWYSTSGTEPAIRLSRNEDMSDYTDFIGTVVYYKIQNGVKYYSNKVTVTDLERHSTYYYQRKLNSKWEDPIKFNTYDENNFNFIFVGDPQIGGSYDHISVADFTRTVTREEGTRNDAFNWNMTVSNSFEVAKTPSVFLSAGDQVDTECFTVDSYSYNLQETQYSAFLLPELLKTIPSATTVGNHESLTKNFKNHYNTPNSYLTPLEKDLAPGYNYFFKYNNVLVVVLETNYGFCDDFKEVMRQAYLKYPDTDWRIAMFHHDIYGNGKYHSQDEYITKKLRPCLTELISKYKFDLVINGHDHVYSASYFVSYENNTKGYEPKSIKKGEVNENPNGTFYITANCSSGSKLYGYVEKDFDYIYQYNQTYSSTFGIMDFEKEDGKVRLNINYYEVDTRRKIDGPYIIEKSEKCWSKKLGFPCCKTNKEVVFEDNDGKWGVEYDDWCGIIEEDIPYDTNPVVSNEKIPENCWAYELGYQCCFETGPENARQQDQYGKWGVEWGRWCGIIENTEPITTTTKTIPITTTTTTTKTIPITTTTTTTKTIPITTTTTTTKTVPMTTTTTTTIRTTTTRTTTTTTTPTPTATVCAKLYDQCGGMNYYGPTCCEGNSRCNVHNEYYSQCEPYYY